LAVVIQRLCLRCHSVLHVEDEGSLVFCWNCGAPQVRLSEELLEQAELQLAARDASQNNAGEPAPRVTTPVWRGAIQCAALAGAIAGVLTLVSFAYPPVVLLSWLWAIGAPIVVLGVYSSRFRLTRITPGFGARLGLLSALAILLASLALNTAALLLARFAFHASGKIDTSMNTVFAQLRTNTQAQSGAAAAPLLNLLSVPEFRIGLLLTSAAIFLVLYLVYSALAGVFAGYLRSRAPAR
jgi:hypothetical protein